MSPNIHLRTVEDLLQFFALDQPVHHPLMAVVDFGQVREGVIQDSKLSTDFYTLIFKTYNRNHVRYGRKLVDFTNGSLICLAPNQVLEMDDDIEGSPEMSGWGLAFHPDLIRGTPLNDKMKSYTFFSYEVSEALHLSEKEKQILTDCVQKLNAELQENIDVHSQAILVSGIEMILNYCSRFYGRQFITRKTSNHAVIVQVEKLLNEYFGQGDLSEQGLPTVRFLADQVHLSPNYLSDLLKRETGKNAQDHIHYHLIEEAKNVLLSSNRSVGEIAYGLGFEYPQYFNKLFKQKTGKTPAAFRSLN